MRRRSTSFAAVALVLAAGACGLQSEPARTPPPPPAKVAPPQRAVPGHLARADVERVLALGPPWLLRRVLVEDAERDGKFIGWRLVALPEEWKGVDLKPGDIVTKVNGTVVEKPDDLYDVWVSLAAARELRIDYERDGAPRQLAILIDGAPSKAPRPARPEPRVRAKPKGTIVIEEDGTQPE